MNAGISGPSDRSLQGSTTAKSEQKGSLTISGIGTSISVSNKTTSSTQSPITESKKTTPSPPPRPPSKGTKLTKHLPSTAAPSSTRSSTSEESNIASTPRIKGGTSAKRAASAAASGLHQTTTTPSDLATQSAIESAAASQEFIEDSLAADLAGSGLLQQKRDLRETDRRRRAGDTKTGKSEEEGEEGDEPKTGKVENIETAQEREEDGEKGNKHQELFDRLEQLAREGKITGLPDIINLAWGKNGVYKDVTNAYDGLRAAQQHFGEKDDDLLKNLSNSSRAAGDILYRENGPDIRTGYLFGPGTDATISYRESVIRFEKASDTFKAIIQKVEGNPRLFTNEINTLIKLIQIDMKAQESTLDPTHLTQIMQGLFKVQICLQLKTDCDLLLRDMQTLYNNPPDTQN